MELQYVDDNNNDNKNKVKQEGNITIKIMIILLSWYVSFNRHNIEDM